MVFNGHNVIHAFRSNYPDKFFSFDRNSDQERMAVEWIRWTMSVEKEFKQ